MIVHTFVNGFNCVTCGFAIKGSNASTGSLAYTIRIYQKLFRTKLWSFNVKHVLSKLNKIIYFWNYPMENFVVVESVCHTK
eukprot:UN07401